MSLLTQLSNPNTRLFSISVEKQHSFVENHRLLCSSPLPVTRAEEGLRHGLNMPYILLDRRERRQLRGHNCQKFGEKRQKQGAAAI